MNQQLAIKESSVPSESEFTIILQQAEMLVKTGFLPQAIKTKEQAVAIILTGRELGIPSMAALNTINVIQGKPTISPQLMLALIERSGQLENIKYNIETDHGSCTMKRKNRSEHTESFGTKEAIALGLMSKDNYKKQAQTMFKWRVTAAVARLVFPDVILGLYTPDEMGADVTIDGEIQPQPVREFPKKVEPVKTIAATEPTRLQILAPILSELNQTGDSIKWEPSVLLDYAREQFGEDFTELDALDLHDFNILQADLEERLQERLALTAEAVEGEAVEELSAEKFEEEVF